MLKVHFANSYFAGRKFYKDQNEKKEIILFNVPATLAHIGSANYCVIFNSFVNPFWFRESKDLLHSLTGHKHYSWGTEHSSIKTVMSLKQNATGIIFNAHWICSSEWYEHSWESDGGRLLHWMDIAAAITNGHCGRVVVVTASVTMYRF